MRRLLLIAMIAPLLFAGTAWAGAFEDGFVALQRGDHSEAIRLFRVAAAQGNALAQAALGTAYEIGEGVARNYVEAVKWYRLAAAQGEATAQCGLGGAYETGHGVARN